jgi:hypothetical protein
LIQNLKHIARHDNASLDIKTMRRDIECLTEHGEGLHKYSQLSHLTFETQEASLHAALGLLALFVLRFE